jgi:hypothetical protein
MKKWAAYILILTALSCSNDIEEVLVEEIVEEGTIIYQGSFVGTRNYRVSGRVEIIQLENTKILQFKNFLSSSGPDLKVYLSSSLVPEEFVNLGDLKALSGVFSYTLPEGFTVEQDGSFVLVYCERFSALFGSAELIMKEDE